MRRAMRIIFNGLAVLSLLFASLLVQSFCWPMSSIVGSQRIASEGGRFQVQLCYGQDPDTGQTFIGVAEVFVPYPPVLGLLLILLIACAVIRRWLREAVRPSSACPHCGYDLRATPDRCPECGAVPTQAAETVA